MAIVVPEGFVFNKAYAKLRRYLFQNSRVLLIAHLPGGCFLPYTAAKSAIIYLIDKGIGKTEWFYRARVKNDGYTLDAARSRLEGLNDLDEILYFFKGSSNPSTILPDNTDLRIVHVENLESDSGFYLREEWSKSSDREYLELQEIAVLKNGNQITEETTTLGSIPVIAGGRGTVPYTHGEANYHGNMFTISKSGAYAGYVWWHDEPIWASDSIAIRSRDESEYLTKFLFICLKSQQDEIYLRQQGTGQPHIYTGHVESFPIPKMTLDQQVELLEKYENAETRLLEAQERVDNFTREMDSIIQSVY